MNITLPEPFNNLVIQNVSNISIYQGYIHDDSRKDGSICFDCKSIKHKEEVLEQIKENIIIANPNTLFNPNKTELMLEKLIFKSSYKSTFRIALLLQPGLPGFREADCVTIDDIKTL